MSLKNNTTDYAKITVGSGNGAKGVVHFRTAPFVPKGGPDGGNGGDGGHIILQGNPQLSNLLHFRYRKHIFAENGKTGGRKNITGANGKNSVLQVPLGTVAKDADTGEIKTEITEANQKIILLQGGKGGKGNTYFKSATRQAPSFAQPGEEGKKLVLVLELKLMADIGLLGLPNAGKSTLLSVISAAKPQIANYPFTTINPQLGTVMYVKKSFLVADIPGIIQGASRGKGLGLHFLKHAERTRILVFVVAANDINIINSYYILIDELKAYNPDLLDKKHLLVISKTDLYKEDELARIIQKLPRQVDYIMVSSKKGQGIKKFKDKLWRLLYTTS